MLPFKRASGLFNEGIQLNSVPVHFTPWSCQAHKHARQQNISTKTRRPVVIYVSRSLGLLKGERVSVLVCVCLPLFTPMSLGFPLSLLTAQVCWLLLVSDVSPGSMWTCDRPACCASVNKPVQPTSSSWRRQHRDHFTGGSGWRSMLRSWQRLSPPTHPPTSPGSAEGLV